MTQTAIKRTEALRHLGVLPSFDIRQTDVATEVGLRSPKALREHYHDELARSRRGGEINVGKALLAMAAPDYVIELEKGIA